MAAPTTRSVRAAYNPSVKVAYINEASGTTFTAVAAVTGKRICVMEMHLAFGGSGSSLVVMSAAHEIFNMLQAGTYSVSLGPRPTSDPKLYVEHFCTDEGEALRMTTVAACKGTVCYVESDV